MRVVLTASISGWASAKIRFIFGACLHLIAHTSTDWMMMLTYTHGDMYGAAKKPCPTSNRGRWAWRLEGTEHGTLQMRSSRTLYLSTNSRHCVITSAGGMRSRRCVMRQTNAVTRWVFGQRGRPGWLRRVRGMRRQRSFSRG